VQIVELKDTGCSPMLQAKPYKEIYREIRGAVDLCHRDGSLKKAVAEEPAKYIHQVNVFHVPLPALSL
jgi:5'-nucleotidase